MTIYIVILSHHIVTLSYCHILTYSFPSSEPFHCFMSSLDYCFLTYTAYRLLRRQVRWSSIPISLRIFHSLLWSTVKGSGVVNEAEVDGFLEFPCFLYDPMDVSNLISGSSTFSKSSLYIWKFSVHLLLKPSLKDFSIILLACEMNELYGSLNTLGHCPSLGLE